MEDFPLMYAKHGDIMASEKMKDKGYVKWVLKQENPTGPVLKFKNYVLSHRASLSSPEPPATPGSGPSSSAPPATTGATSLSQTPSAADPSLHRKLDRLERKVDALTELVRCLMTGEEPPSATESTPDVTREAPEPSALATLA
jgi:hypothetical protein